MDECLLFSGERGSGDVLNNLTFRLNFVRDTVSLLQ